MCGLAALFAYGADAPPIAEAELMAMREAMRARGPDGAGLWLAPEGRVGLAHRRLAIIDLSPGGAQPMAIDDGRLRIAYNGEIYNYKALRAELEAVGERFQGESDTEVILRLYRRVGPACVERLRGMFAFALWDEASRGMLLARDPFGIKPLYYADDGRTVRVASTVKGLRAGGAIDGALDPAGAVGYFLFGSVPEPHTLHRAVKALPAGHVLWFDRAGTRGPKAFFDAGETLAAAARPEGALDLRARLLDSVRHHMVADVPVGVFLSAGLDAATVAALAAETRGTRLDTLTLGFREFEGTARDEVPLAEAVARSLGTRHHTERVTGATFQGELANVLAAMDQPTIDGVNIYFVARAARERGLKVALSGLGGDELFGGYDSFRQIPALVAALRWLPGARTLGRSARIVTASLARRLTSPKLAGAIEYGTRMGDAYLLRRGLYMPWELTDVLDPDLARAGWAALEPLTRLNALADRAQEPRRAVQALEMTWYMRNQLLRDADWAGMAHGVEIRVPFVDARLFQDLAPWLGRAGGPDKRAMALTPKAPLPDAVLRRPKTGFFVPVREWLAGEEKPDPGQPGLRGWARRVYAAFTAPP
jgi:asparagine synthase (glutamine-hydrolysing)